MNKVKKAAFSFIAVGLLLIAAGVGLSLLLPLTPLNDTVSSKTLYFSDVRELIVITGTLSVRVEPTDGDICEVSYLSDLPVVANTDELGTLRLTQDDDFSLTFFSARRRDFHLTVKLPARSYERISLSSSSGSIACGAIPCGSLELSTRSGSIAVDGADQRLKLRTESGAVDLRLTDLSDDMTVAAGTGDIRLAAAEGLSYCLVFLTEDGGRLFEEGESPSLGDKAIFRAGAKNRLTVTTTGGDLYFSEFTAEEREG
ncbi:MAG: DUF4097 domain-containing protein [Bacteroides sp.]|nr:DUF4097 domain-containing protein [Eubacterium sp.]MCM1418500.1 DUF4097 domain-containing protein [Roseburia sp.]MCM1462519.1 DUF4097 domain-containing protein [Bacteroides sp.]